MLMGPSTASTTTCTISPKPGNAAIQRSSKRKRITDPDPLEIDVSQPEPLSKKELRKAKKSKEAVAVERKEAIDAGAESESAAERDEEDVPAKEQAKHGVWIGNLPWTATKAAIRSLLIEKCGIRDTQITRVHLPTPSKPAAVKGRTKAQNKGFAYVDVDSEASKAAVIGISETLMGGRRLLIKDAASFKGRPDPSTSTSSTAGGLKQASSQKQQHPPGRRVFVGNLAFEVTQDDLSTLFSRCGSMVETHMATFEDSGKCKGYAWITFEDVEQATHAVRGWVDQVREEDQLDDDELQEDRKTHDMDSAAKEHKSKPVKKRVFVNRLHGRPVRCEFAEDGATRYKKRYGRAEGKAGAEKVTEEEV